jgi:phosphatidylglycerophosphatase B
LAASESDDPRVALRRFALVVAIAYVGVLSSFALPEIPLDGLLARLAVRISDSASWQQLPFFATAMVIVVISRPHLDTRRRALEAIAIIAILLLILAGNAQLNESVIKPAFAIPRPNLVALADQGALGLGVDEFYAVGDKQARREWLAPRLAELNEPRLAPIVSKHWAVETGFSFPSGHATASMTFASLMVAIGLRWTNGWRRTLTLLLPIWAVAVVFTRPLLRVHTYIDVSVGAAVGIWLGMLGFAILHALLGGRATDRTSVKHG